MKAKKSLPQASAQIRIPYLVGYALRSGIGCEWMDWSLAVAALNETKAPSGYELGLLHRDDVVGLIEQLRAWYPDLTVSSEACHVTPEFYYEQTVLDDIEADRPILPVVALYEKAIVGLITFEKDASATLMCRVGVNL